MGRCQMDRVSIEAERESARTAILARRNESNRALADRDVDRHAAILDARYATFPGSLGLAVQREAILRALKREFSANTLLRIVRTTQWVRLDESLCRAAEQGSWVSEQSGEHTIIRKRGAFLATWIAGPENEWHILNESFVTLQEQCHRTTATP